MGGWELIEDHVGDARVAFTHLPPLPYELQDQVSWRRKKKGPANTIFTSQPF